MVTRIQNIRDPQGSESYVGLGSTYQLRFPFSLYFIQQLEGFKALFIDDTQVLQQDESNINISTGKLQNSICT